VECPNLAAENSSQILHFNVDLNACELNVDHSRSLKVALLDRSYEFLSVYHTQLYTIQSLI